MVRITATGTTETSFCAKWVIPHHPLSLPRLRAKVPVLPGKCGGGLGENVVDAEKNLLPNSRAQLVRELYHLHDPAQQRSAGKTEWRRNVLVKPRLTRHTFYRSCAKLLKLVFLFTTIHLTFSTSRHVKISTARRGRQLKYCWSLQIKSSPIFSFWRCY